MVPLLIVPLRIEPGTTWSHRTFYPPPPRQAQRERARVSGTHQLTPCVVEPLAAPHHQRQLLHCEETHRSAVHKQVWCPRPTGIHQTEEGRQTTTSNLRPSVAGTGRSRSRITTLGPVPLPLYRCDWLRCPTRTPCAPTLPECKDRGKGKRRCRRRSTLKRCGGILVK